MTKAIITGASSGLGKEMARKLISKNYKVINISRTPSDVHGVMNLKADLSNNADIDYIISQLDKDHQDTNLLVLNSGLMHRNMLGESSNSEIDDEFSVNITSMIKIVNAMIKILKANKGDIVIIGSTSSFNSASEGSSVYVSAKHAVLGYIKALQYELKKDDVRIIGVHPGGFKSQFHIKAKSNLSQDDLMDPKYIADMIMHSLELPRDMEVSEIIINRKKK